MSLVRELWEFLKVRKKFWLAPIFIFVAILSTLSFIATVAPAAAPWLYTIW
jgi:hypothetical protein